MTLRAYNPGPFPQLYDLDSLRSYLTGEFAKISNSVGDVILVGGDASGQVPGTATNDDALAGNVGEFISSEVAQGAAVPLTTNVSANVTSITLTRGDWDVWINAALLAGANTNTTSAQVSVSTASATLQSNPQSRLAVLPLPGGGFTGPSSTTSIYSIPVGPTRISLATTTTVYFVVRTAFTGTIAAYGSIQARRAR